MSEMQPRPADAHPTPPGATRYAVVGGATVPVTGPAGDRQFIIGSIIGSQALSGVTVPRDVAERIYDEVAAEPLITVTPGVQGSAPCIAGTRIPARMVAELHRGGMPVERIMVWYSGGPLTREQVEAAIAYEEQQPAPPAGACPYCTAADALEMTRYDPAYRDHWEWRCAHCGGEGWAYKGIVAYAPPPTDRDHAVAESIVAQLTRERDAARAEVARLAGRLAAAEAVCAGVGGMKITADPPDLYAAYATWRDYKDADERARLAGEKSDA